MFLNTFQRVLGPQSVNALANATTLTKYKRNVVCISGTQATGKSTLAKSLASSHLDIFSSGPIFRHLALSRDLTVTEFSNSLRNSLMASGGLEKSSVVDVALDYFQALSICSGLRPDPIRCVQLIEDLLSGQSMAQRFAVEELFDEAELSRSDEGTPIILESRCSVALLDLLRRENVPLPLCRSVFLHCAPMETALRLLHREVSHSLSFDNSLIFESPHPRCCPRCHSALPRCRCSKRSDQRCAAFQRTSRR